MSTSEDVDVMVVGSGFGGAVAALRLAQRGISVTMLERGKRWPLTPEQNTFSSLESPDGRSAWLSDVSVLGDAKPIDRSLGVLELVLGDGIAAFAGAGVGGGSLVYAGVLIEPPRELFGGIFGDLVRHDQMRPYFARVRSVMKPEPVPRKILARPEYAGARTWLELGREAGLPTERVDMGVDWRVVADELDGNRVPSISAGDFWYGNNSGAKRSLDRTYLHRAERTGRLRLVTHQNVVSVSGEPGGPFRVVADQLADDGEVVRQRHYVVRRLLLCAGSLGTSRLLTRAKGRGELPFLDPSIGSRWGNNGDFFSAVAGVSSRVRPNLGGTAPVIIRDLENPVMPTVVECFSDWTRDGRTGEVASIGMAPVPARGGFTYDEVADDVTLHWPGGDPDIRRVVEAGTKTYERVAEAGGPDCGRREPVHSLAFGMGGHRPHPDPEPTPIDASATAHPLGGVPLGMATDAVGRVRGYPGLYVLDGSLVPGQTGCANPALTIAALAERNIDCILHEDLR